MKLRYLLPALALLANSAAQADDYDKIKAKGEIVIGVRDSSPPFGFFDKKSGTVTGYDVEFALHVAKKLGFKPVFKTLDPAERIPALKDGRVDLVMATFAKTKEREREVDFSLGYFVATQKLLAGKGKFHDLLQLDKMTVCVPKGATNAGYLRNVSTGVTILELADYTEDFNALRAGKCEAVSGPEPTLLGNLAKLPNKQDYEVADVPIASEVYAVGIRKGEKRLAKAVNEALTESESSGEAARIFETYFGLKSAAPMMRTFKIMP
ncbi:transporter substrate-binding domain-containing protein [Chitinimonas sp.]|uniref:transporter substrate-binding domain-containing protein n=1 Tax=Chitinimonas sp. TaxID=1934313 RepID=UPI002F92653F